MENKNSICMMAFSKGVESTEAKVIKRYVGVGAINVLGVNPNKQELEKLYNTTIDKEPEYITEKDGVKSARIDFMVKTTPDCIDSKTGEPIELISKYTIFLRNEYMYNRDKTKVKVIDKYGRTAWVTIEQAKAHEIPMYKNGPANIDAEYRPMYIGEEDLVNFLIAHLNIPSVMRYVDNKWIMVDTPENSEAGLEKIPNYFKGDFSELKTLTKLMPNNRLKVCFGVRTTDDGRMYQTFFTEMPMKNGVNNFTKLKALIDDRKANGAYSTTEFSTEGIHEYTVEASNFNGSNMNTEAPVANTDPFAAGSSDDNLPF